MSNAATWNVLCHDCGYEYLAEYYSNGIDAGYAVDSEGEECIECGSNNIEATNEWYPPTLHKLQKKLGLLVILLVPNFLLFWS